MENSIRSSQKFFPTKKRKGLPEREIYNIRLAELKIDPDKMMKLYNTNFLPILSKDDPPALKLTRDHHVQILSWIRYTFPSGAH